MGATIDSPKWVVSPPPDPIRLASALRVLLTDQGIVALEGISIDRDIAEALEPFLVDSTLDIKPGTVWPRSKWLHVQATSDALEVLERLVNSYPAPQVCDNLYGHERATLLLRWHDTFGDPISVSGAVDAVTMDAFCSSLGVGPARLDTRR